MEDTTDRHAIYHREGANNRNSDRNNFQNDGEMWDLSSDSKKINEESVENRRMDLKNNDSHKNQELSTKHLSNTPAQETTPKERILPERFPDALIDRLMPSTAMKMAEKLKEISVDELKMNSRGREEVFVCDVFDPSFFWVQLCNRKQMFDKFMNDLESFYTRESNNPSRSTGRSRYLIPSIAYKKGLHVACIYGNKWHRGVIAKVTSDDDATVFFSDYGTVKTYSPLQLYYLHKQFASLPAQAIRCGMYNLRPSKVAKWSQDITNKFTRKVSDIPLVAYILSIDTENNSMLVSLIDKSDHIDDWLLKNHYAEMGRMCTTEPVKDICYYDEDLIVKRMKEEKKMEAERKMEEERKMEAERKIEAERKMEAEKQRTKDQKFKEYQEKHSPLHGSTSNASACCCHSSSVVPFTLTDQDIYRSNIQLMQQNADLRERIKETRDLLKSLTLKFDAAKF